LAGVVAEKGSVSGRGVVPLQTARREEQIAVR
jgi:hypothetical protein